MDVLNLLGSKGGTEGTNLPAHATGKAEEEWRKRREGEKRKKLCSAHYTSFC